MKPSDLLSSQQMSFTQRLEHYNQEILKREKRQSISVSLGLLIVTIIMSYGVVSWRYKTGFDNAGFNDTIFPTPTDNPFIGLFDNQTLMTVEFVTFPENPSVSSTTEGPNPTGPEETETKPVSPPSDTNSQMPDTSPPLPPATLHSDNSLQKQNEILHPKHRSYPLHQAEIKQEKGDLPFIKKRQVIKKQEKEKNRPEENRKEEASPSDMPTSPPPSSLSATKTKTEAGTKTSSQAVPPASQGGSSAAHSSLEALHKTATWQASLLARLEKFKHYPSAAMADGQKGVPLISFTMNRLGRVVQTTLEKSSGHRLLDDEALSLPQRAQPLPAPPETVRGTLIRLTVPVEFTIPFK